MIVVCGDAILDRDVLFMSTGRVSPETGKPIVRQNGDFERPGGALAVRDMVHGLGIDCAWIGANMRSLKSRFKVDGVEMFRCDLDAYLPMQNGEADQAIRRIERQPPDLILVADYGKGTITPYLWEKLVGLGIRIIVDPARGRPFSFYRGAWAITPNRQEMLDERERGGTCDLAFPFACAKLDRDGLFARVDGKTVGEFQSVAKQPIVDCCGAGDQVLAALGVATVQGKSWLEACEFANLAAGVKCGKVGAVPVTMEEIEQFKGACPC